MKGKNLTGLRLGKLTVVAPTEERVRNAIVWRCRCDCGKEILVESRRLKPDAIYSCGCENPPREIGKDLTGMRFGKLTVLGKSGEKAKDGNPLWLCRCDCGNRIETTKRRLMTGNTSSCGCGKKPQLKAWVGKRFGMLTVLSYARKENGVHIWHCKYDCGNFVDVRQSNLQNGWTTSCGCRRNPVKNLHYVDGTCVENIRSESLYRTNTSGIRGVYYSKQRKKWIAQIMFQRKCYNLGGYDTLEDAAQVRKMAEDKIFGDFLEWYGQEHGQKEEYSEKKNQEDAYVKEGATDSDLRRKVSAPNRSIE
ncbi:MAG: transcriptional regulator [Fusicatenibacter sp.]|nr:transcriptional regulator [Fusicatenibacter sp.]